MKTWLLQTGLVLGTAGTGLHAAVNTNTIFADDFESGTLVQWTTTGSNPLDPSTDQNVVPPAPAGRWSAYLNTSLDRMHHNLLADNGGAEVNGHSVFTCWILDPGPTAPATRIFCEVRGYAGGSGLPNGGTVTDGTLSQLLAIGKYNTVTLTGEVWNATKYQGRSILGFNAWFNLDAPGSPNRSVGWHRFDIERMADGTTINYYVDGVLSRTITGTGAETWDTVIMGPGLGATVGDAWIDGISVSVLVPATPRTPWWFSQPLLPPAPGEYVSPPGWLLSYANGIILSNVIHRGFLQSFPPPPPGGSEVRSFDSEVQFEVAEGGPNPAPIPVSADVTVRITHAGTAADGTQTFDTEMLALSTAPAGIMLRESPTRASTGRTTIRTAPGGGYMIDSFFDVFTELSLDGGQTWSPSTEAAPMELRTDARTIPPIVAPTPILPPPVDLFVSSQPVPILLAQGLQVRNLRHKIFTQGLPPPEPGAGTTHSFDSQVDLELSQDGGQTWRPLRAPAAVTVQIRHRSDAPDGTRTYDTEMLALNLAGGDLPASFQLRESPTLRSQGGTALRATANGQYRMSSFFDIFTELSVDGGQVWTPSPAAAHMELICEAPPSPFPSPNLPPPSGEYASTTQGVFAAFAQGILLRNVVHHRFTQSLPPPPPGGQQHHNFALEVRCELSLDGGQTWQPATFPAQATMRVLDLLAHGDTRYFETEMLQLDISGGTHPAIRLRESPTRASLGRTSIRMVNDPGTGIWDYISSFFDVFTELSVDGGASWSPSLTGPGTLTLRQPPCELGINCPNDLRVWACAAAGALAEYPLPTATGRCPPFGVVCIPPSGSTFPIGTTTVACRATDAQGNTSQCSFQVNVTLDAAPPRILCPPDVIQCETNGVVVNYPPPTVTDDCDPTPTVVCDPPSGSPFPPGTTVVTCRATDDCGNESKCDFTVTIVPDRPPVLSVTREGRFLVICWPKTCGCYLLQAARELNRPIPWVDVGDVPTDFGDHYCVRIPVDRMMRYFRLIQCQRTAAPIFDVQASGLTPAQAASLADAMGIPRAQLQLEGGAALFVDAQRFQAIPTRPIQDPAILDELTRDTENDGGQLAFNAIDFQQLRQLRPLPPQAAMARFEAALRQANLVPAGGEASAVHTLFDAVDERGRVMLEDQPIDTHVAYQFDLGGVPLTGPGAVVRAALSPGGEPTALHYALRQVQPGPVVPLVPVEEAARRCKTLYPNLRASGQPQLVYFAPSLLLPAVQKIIPCYECGGVARVSGGLVNLIGTIIPATEDPALVPAVVLNASAQGNSVSAQAAVSGGAPPYAYQWLSSSVDLSSAPPGPGIQYDARPRGTETSETVRVLVTDANGVQVQAMQVLEISGGGGPAGGPGAGFAPAAGGVTDYGTERAVSDMGASQQSGFNGRFAAEGFTRRFNFTGTSCWERDFKEGGTGLDHLFADNADMVFYIGHGNGGGITFESTQDDGALTYTDAAGAFGDVDNEWLALLSCQVLKDEYDGKKWHTRWGPTFAGLHLLLGFETNARDQSGFGSTFAQWTLGYQIASLTLPPMPVRSSWFLAKAQAQPADRVAVAIGVVGPDGCSNYDDYFWGKGPVGPDIRGANIHGYWRVRFQ